MDKRRICIMYDGYSFKLTSNYFKFGHPIRQRIDFNGLDSYMLNKVAEAIGISEKNCAIVGRHLYMGMVTGRNETPELAKKNNNFSELLKKSNITPHFRPLQLNEDGSRTEKMIDSDLICDALEMAYKREADVLVLVARDKDYIPMIEKLNKEAIESALFWWDTPEYMVEGEVRSRKPQRTAEILINTVTYQFEMTPIAGLRKRTALENGIFYREREPRPLTERVRPAAIVGTTSPLPAYAAADVSQKTSAAVEPIEKLIMNTAPRELTMDELKITYESLVIALDLQGRGGFVKGPAEFANQALNNFQFGVHDIGDRQVSDFSIGARVHFMLKYDPKRSEQYGCPLYRVYNMTLAPTVPRGKIILKREMTDPQNAIPGIPIP